MLQICAVAPDTLELLKKLQAIPELADTRLVGGTALAFHLGHRLSIDLDLFGSFDSEIITGLLQLGSFDSFQVVSDSKVLKHYFINQIKVDIVKYDRYKWLDECVIENQIRIAGLKDIAAMKIAAIINRGSRKDFVDLYFLLKIFDIKEIIGLYQTKYCDSDIFVALRSLSYFNDAEKEAMPKMLIPTTWDEVKTKLASAIREM